MTTVKLLRYPVYSLATDGRYIVTSGGGGGKEYGISNLVEFHVISEKDHCTDMSPEAAASDGFNVLDCVEYLAEHNVWMGSMVEGTVFFTYQPESGIRILGRVVTAKRKEDPSQDVGRLAGAGDMFITGSRDGTVRVWKLTNRIITTFKENLEGEGTPKLGLCLTDDYSPPEKPVVCAHRHEDSEVGNNSKESEELLTASDSNAEGDSVELPDCSIHTLGKTPKGRGRRRRKRRVANLLLQYGAHSKEINDCHLSRDGVLAASVCADYLIMYKVAKSMMVCKHKSNMRFKFCRFVNTACQDDKYRLITIEWEPKEQRAVATVWNYSLSDRKLSVHVSACIGSKPCSALALSKDESYLGLGFGTGEVAVYKTQSLKCISREQRHMLPVTDVAFLGDRLVSSGADFYVVIKNYQGGIFIYILTILVPIIAFLLYYFTHMDSQPQGPRHPSL